MVDAAAVHRRKAEEIRLHFNPRVRTGPWMLQCSGRA